MSKDEPSDIVRSRLFKIVRPCLRVQQRCLVLVAVTFGVFERTTEPD